jgi:hypothetical protein
MAALGIGRHLDRRSIDPDANAPGSRTHAVPRRFSASARDVTSLGCCAQWLSGMAASQVATVAAGLLHYASFSAVRYSHW